MIRLFLLFLEFWVAGASVFLLVHLIDLFFTFQNQGRSRAFCLALILMPFWPFALLSGRGRFVLFESLILTQES